MSITKKYLADERSCMVTFKFDLPLSEPIRTISVVGDFNNWDPIGNPMKRGRNGKFSLSMNFPIEKDFQFRYLVDGKDWFTDFEADSLAPIPWSEEFNSVIKL